MRFNKKTTYVVMVASILIGIVLVVRMDFSRSVQGWKYIKRLKKNVLKTSDQRPLPTWRRESSYCPYYPNEIQDITTRIFDRESVVNLRKQVGSLSRGSPINLLVANQNVLLMLANWLCTARNHLDGLDSVLIVTPPGDSMAAVLRGKGIKSVQINFSSWCKQRINSSTVTRQFMIPLATRVLTIMLLTHWGYDVAVYDPDAFLRNNPIDAYKRILKKLNADAIFQKGKFPFNVGAIWGFTVCCGAAYYRGSSKLDRLWTMMSEEQMKLEDTSQKLNDQILTNCALKALNVTWTKTSLFDSHIGITANSGPKVVALGSEYSRRKWPSENPSNEELISHPKTAHNLEGKIKKLRQHSMWFLSANPTELNNDKRYSDPKDWLNDICVAIDED